ncbi:hypothetical protein [Gehongia tenuis]|uniref:Uncharacterized protein n=1 Tax=Gehongia tenuis TaxID=2763655 RepID=A0A926D4G4_9FIRM|nr:hypothetical protein [Gehongia tenuis]MBC8531563.1 hypothetical protein [Gehongia tenuis]
MNRIFCTLYKNHKRVAEACVPMDFPLREDTMDSVIAKLCYELDTEKPMIMDKHFNELQNFSQTRFRADDFIDSIKFDYMLLEILEDDKKRKKHS